MSAQYGATDCESPKVNSQLPVKLATQDMVLAFIRKLYCILSAQLLITLGIAYPIFVLADKNAQVWAHQYTFIICFSLAILIITMLLLICRMAKVPVFPLNYVFLLVITICMAVIIGILTAMLTWKSVFLAVGMTLALFLLMTAYAKISPTKFTGIRPYVVAGLFCVCCFGVVIVIIRGLGLYVGRWLLIYDFLGVLLFSFYVVFDTQRMITGKHRHQFSVDDYAFGTLSLYLDTLTIVWDVLTLAGTRH